MSKLAKARTVLHAISVILSAVISALTAHMAGGDPVLGASIGATANTVVAALSEV